MVKNNIFKDHFSRHSVDYSRFRPLYPDALFHYLASLTENHDLAWDCATGSGQAAQALSKHYAHVIASDASYRQLEHSQSISNISYRVEMAESSSLDDQTADIVTVAQALHWFDIPTFFEEVDRVLKPGGVLAVWTYDRLVSTALINKAIDYLYTDLLSPYWPKERRHVETHYLEIQFPYEPIESAPIKMTAEWNFDQFIGYLSTWSAVKKYQKNTGENPLEKIMARLRKHTADPQATHIINWPLTLIIGRKQFTDT